TSGMGLVLGGRARVVLTGHADTSWVDDLATQRSSQGYTFSLGSGSVSWRSTRSSSVLSSSCEAEIYARGGLFRKRGICVCTGGGVRSGGCVESGIYVRSACSVLLVSGTLSPDSPLAPPPRSPLAAASPQHALPSPCLWPSQVPALPPVLACTAVPSLRRGAAARRSSLLRDSCDHCSYVDSPYGRGGEFSSDLPAEICRDKGIVRSFTLPALSQQNGIAERRIGLIMEVAHTSMIHAAAPHFLWPFALRYAAHQLNLWPHVSRQETSPTLWWTGKVGNALVFRVWGALSLVRNAKASKFSSRTLRCVFLGFPTDGPPWQFYHPCSRRVFSSQDVTFDGSVCFYRLHPHTSHPLTAVDSGAETVGAEPRGVETEGEGYGGGTTGGATTGGAATRGAATGGADSGGAASPSGGGAVGDLAGGPGPGQPPQPDLPETLSLQAIRVWIVRRGSPGGGGYGPAGAGAASPGALRRPVYDLRQAPHEWHDTLRMKLVALGFAPSSTDPSLFLRTDTSLPPFYVLVYVDGLVFATANKLSGPYPELVGCLTYVMTCRRPDLTYPLNLLAYYVAPGRHRKVHWDAAKRVLHYLCSRSGMGLVLGGQGSMVLKGDSDASWADDQASQRSSQGYTFSLGCGFVPWRSTLLYVDNKAMLALCWEQRLKHRTKHIALCYFLAQELQQRGQLCLSYVASRANTADVFTKALGSGDLQRLCTALGLLHVLPHLLVS
ncbi:unnamed protein product, partial [Closterium sp. NIES-53]